MRQHIAARIQCGDLAPIAKPGIKGKDTTPFHWWRHKQLPEVGGEHVDGLRIGLLLELRMDFRFRCRHKQPAERIGHCR